MSATLSLPTTADEPAAEPRYTPGQKAALRRFGVIITVVTVLGHVWFGFEQSYLQPVVAVLVGYAAQLLLDSLDAWATGRRPRFLAGGAWGVIDALLPAHISALALAMLLYTNDRLAVLAFAVLVAIGSKHLVRVPTADGSRHILNPSNFALSVCFALLPWVSVAEPYQFTANLSGVMDWALPAVVLVSGGFLNLTLTKKGPLILAFWAAFVGQAVVRCSLTGNALVPSLAPMTSFAFMLFSFYMISDPATTPRRVGRQVAFGAAVGLLYGGFMALHIVYGLFYALTLVSLVRGAWMTAEYLTRRPKAVPQAG